MREERRILVGFTHTGRTGEVEAYAVRRRGSRSVWRAPACWRFGMSLVVGSTVVGRVRMTVGSIGLRAQKRGQAPAPQALSRGSGETLLSAAHSPAEPEKSKP